MSLAKRAAKDCAVLSVAGSDCSGGAGIQADLKTFAAHGCYGASVITALTVQNTTGVKDVHPVPPSFVAAQIRCVLDDIDIHAVKTGMLYDASISAEVAEVFKQHKEKGKLAPVVCDPVCVSTSGHNLLKSDALDVLFGQLFPLTTIITPNKWEAEYLLKSRGDSARISTLNDMLHAAERLATHSSCSVLLKGGHLVSSIEEVNELSLKNPGLEVVKQNLLEDNMEILQIGLPDSQICELVADVLYEFGDNKTIFVRPRIETKSTHGTGCTLSSAIACGLAAGMPLRDAIARASVYTHIGILAAQAIGKGHGPLNHLHSINQVSVPRRTSINQCPFTYMLIQDTRQIWKGYVEHDFVKQLGKGTLSNAAFLHFIKQDYHYLKYYARAYGLLAAKALTFISIESAAGVIVNVINEISTHKTFCQSFGITPEELESTAETAATTAYGAYILNVGLQGDHAKLVLALMACLLGYGEVGLWIKKEASRPNSWVVLDGNPYLKWIEDYSGEHYQLAVRVGIEIMEKLVEDDIPSPARLREWKDVWLRCTELEKGFWDMAMAQSNLI